MAYNRKVFNTYYVSTDGNDSNDGLTPNTPWQTIAKVNAMSSGFVAGESVLFKGGQEFVTSSALLIRGANGTGAPITWGSYGNGRATIRRTVPGGYTLALQSQGDVVIENLIIRNTNPITSFVGTGIGIDLGFSGTVTRANIYIRNCEVYGISGNGIELNALNSLSTLSNVTIENCLVHNCINGIKANAPNSGTGFPYLNVNVINCKAYDNWGLSSHNTLHSGSGIVLAGVNGGSIYHSEAYGNGWNNGWASGGPFGIWAHDSQFLTISECESHHNGTGVGSMRLDGGGFDLDGGCNNCTIEYCYSHDNAGAGLSLFEYGSLNPPFTNNTIRYCVSVNDALYNSGALAFWSLESGFTDNRVHNCTIICQGDAAIQATVPAVEFVPGTVALGTLNIQNNIFIIDGANVQMLFGTVQGIWTTNLFFAVGGANLNYSTGGIVANPLFKDYPSSASTIGAYGHKSVRQFLDELKLIPASPAINAGTGTIAGYTFPATDYYGAPSPVGTINIGHHELIL